MLEITDQIRIPDDEFRWSFVRAGGPGGQNVNKVASRAVLRWNLASSPSLPADIKARLCRQQRRRITSAGELVLHAQRFRSQERNRQDCLAKLRELVRQAAALPLARKPTRPTRGSQTARLREKRRRATLKAGRRRPSQE